MPLQVFLRPAVVFAAIPQCFLFSQLHRCRHGQRSSDQQSPSAAQKQQQPEAAKPAKGTAEPAAAPAAAAVHGVGDEPELQQKERGVDDGATGEAAVDHNPERSSK